jgi:putative N-acetylmannosamine-6-phosphate epimerase/predicted NBD/HSP70 family sugar kinase
MAKASLANGAELLRLEGIEAIKLIKAETDAPIMGLIKKVYPDSDLHITATMVEVEQLIEVGCDIISLDGTERYRPHGEQLGDLIKAIHDAGILALTDCDVLASAQYAVACGADVVNTTLAGYTEATPMTTGPDMKQVVEMSAALDIPVMAEGRFYEPAQAWAAMRVGASAVVVGGALNDPVKQTSRFSKAMVGYGKPVGAVDIGGTWLRFGLFSPDWKLIKLDRIPIPQTRTERLDWIEAKAKEAGVERIGISSGGVIDPQLAYITRAKDFIPEHEFTSFTISGCKVFAINDGLATAWGHACHPDYVGGRTASLALGTGVGSGFAEGDHLVCSEGGMPPEINDMQFDAQGTVEDAVGGLSYSNSNDPKAKDRAESAAKYAIGVMRTVWAPDNIVIGGGLGLSNWMREALKDEPGVTQSPFGEDAGIYGAAALALWPPRNIWP